MPRVAVFSSTQFGLTCLTEGIVPLRDITVAGIVSTPSQVSFGSPRKEMSVATHVDFGPVSRKIGCDLIVLTRRPTIDTYRDILSRWQVDLAVVLGWYYLIPAEALAVCEKGWVAIHGSLLPRYRGMAPINWAIINGESKTGATLFYLDSGVDTGDIIAQGPVAITPQDTCATLYAKITTTSVQLLHNFLQLVATGHAPRLPQDHAQATVYPRRRPEDGLIDWTQSSQKIYDFIRAQTKPYPGAFTYADGNKVTIWKAACDSSARTNSLHTCPGDLIRTATETLVVTGSGYLRLLDWSTDEKRGSAQDMLNGISAFDPCGSVAIPASIHLTAKP
jgi:methionyl-tRNA formyltransferase